MPNRTALLSPADYRRQLLIFFDTETTGLDVNTDEIIELAARVDPDCLRTMGVTVDSPALPSDLFTSLIRPQRGSIPAAASAVHGITMADMKNQMSFDLVVAAFLQWLEQWLRAVPACSRVLLVAHNNHRFDGPLLRRQVREANALQPQSAVMSLGMPSYVGFADSLPHFEYIFERPNRSFKLVSLYNWWCRQSATSPSSPTAQTHRAEADVRMLMKVIAHCPERIEVLKLILIECKQTTEISNNIH